MAPRWVTVRLSPRWTPDRIRCAAVRAEKAGCTEILDLLNALASSAPAGPPGREAELRPMRLGR